MPPHDEPQVKRLSLGRIGRPCGKMRANLLLPSLMSIFVPFNTVIYMYIFIIAILSALAAVLSVALVYSRRELQRSQAETEAGREAARAAGERIAALTEERDRIRAESDVRGVRIESLEARLVEQQQMQKTLKEQFRSVAGDVLEEKSRLFRQTNSEAMEVLLKPFRDNIADFKQRVETIHRDDLERHGALRNELERLVELNRRITDETNNLTNAIKGNSKVQGDMGEMILTTLLDHSSLVRGEHYLVQPNLKDEAGNNLRPDVILNLPEKKRIVIDSKVSLTAYLDYTRAEDPAERKAAMERHIESVRAHIRELDRKDYQRLIDCTPDFVIMFVPIESAFLEAVRECREDLWLEAYNRKVILSSPTNLFAMLKLVDDMWQRDNRNRSTERIARLGVKLYDQFVRFVGALEGIGKGLGDAQRSYDEAYKRLTSGNDNLVRNSERLREYGIKPKKLLNGNLLDSAEDEE